MISTTAAPTPVASTASAVPVSGGLSNISRRSSAILV